MNKQAYLDALHKALSGLPPETVASTMAEYEQRFIDGMVAGLREPEIAEALGEPRQVAMNLRASKHLAAYQQARTPANWVRMSVSFIGLAVFNLFMVIPAMVFASLLTAVYVCAFATYLSGVAITASGLAGTNELVLDGPLREFVHFGDDDNASQTRVAIGQTGIQVYDDSDRQADSDDEDEPGAETTSGRIVEKAERVANGTVKISTELDNESRVTQTAFGMCMVIIGILLSLLSLVVTKYTIAAVKRYIQMNFSLLRGR